MCKTLYYLREKKPDKIFIYLHGGPFFTILAPQNDPFAYYLVKKRKNVCLINYPITFGKGGFTDYNYIYTKILKIKQRYSNAKLYLIGESYGGFLTSLFSSQNIFEQIICLSSFISINYQKLFSTEKDWLSKYLSTDSKDFYFLQEKGLVKVPITFINGKNDSQVPWQQFLPLINSSNSHIKIKLFDNYIHRETGSKLKVIIDYIDKIIPQ